MKILPAIDIYNGKAVRLFQGDYNNMTIYNDDPVSVAKNFESLGSEWIHVVDLEGAKIGKAVNFDTIKNIKSSCGLKCEIGGGIRNFETVERYINFGTDRIILGTSAVTDKNFLIECVKNFGEKIAVGVDIKNGNVAIKGWIEDSNLEAINFCEKMQDLGVKFIICTDISKDGAMKGVNLSLYKTLKSKLNLNIIASGGVSSIEDVKKLSELDLYGAIIGKAYYTGAINIHDAIEVSR